MNKAVNPPNRQEFINGRLLQFFGEWKVQSCYGTFPLSKELQDKCPVENSGVWVSGLVQHGIVTGFHFADETLDGPETKGQP